MENRELIEKIQKLLSLATSDNQNEAEIASKKAQELLIKHNLKMSEVEATNLEYSQDEIDFTRSTQESRFVHDLLNKYYFVYIYKKMRHSGNKYIFTGTAENIEIALYIRSFLINAFKSLYKSEHKRQGWSGQGNKASFYYGLWLGLKDQLEEQKSQIDTGNKLIVINNKLRQYVESNNNLKNGNSRVNASNQDAIASGREQGRNLNISRGINSSSQSEIKYLK